MTQKDPEVAKLAVKLDQLEKQVRAMINRILSVERENKLLRGRIGRANDQIGTMERRTLSGKK